MSLTGGGIVADRLDRERRGAVRRDGAAGSARAAEVVVAVPAQTVGVLVAGLAVREIRDTDAVAVGDGVALGVVGAALRADRLALTVAARAVAVGEPAALVGPHAWPTGAVVVDVDARAVVRRAGGAHVVPLAARRIVADGLRAVRRGAVGHEGAAVALGTAEAVLAVPAHAVRRLVAGRAVGEVEHADAILTMRVEVAVSVRRTARRAVRRRLPGAAVANDIGIVAAARRHGSVEAARVVLHAQGPAG